MNEKILRLSMVFAFLLIIIGSTSNQVSTAVLTPQNWSEMTGFKPDVTKLPDIKNGMEINKNNWKKFESYIPSNIAILIDKFNLVLTFKEYTPFHPSLSYIDATNKYYKQVTYKDMGNEARKSGIQNYVAGLPFPNPRNGLEIAYDYHFSYNGDDADNYYGVYWISAQSGVERFEEWKWTYIYRTTHRTDVEPIPNIPEFEKQGIQYTSMTSALEPYDKKGLTALYNRFEEPKDQEGWLYIPTMRRVLKATIGTRGDAWNSTDMLYEDVRGYMGYPEWMNWKLVEKRTVLAPMGAEVPLGKENINKIYDFKKWPNWNPKMNWQPRPVYVVEAIPKFADYPYSRMIVYFDAETYLIPLKECYDKKGELWKIIVNGYNDSTDPDKLPPAIGTAIAVDIQAEHATAFPWYECKINTGIDPSFFTQSNLRKIGK